MYVYIILFIANLFSLYAVIIRCAFFIRLLYINSSHCVLFYSRIIHEIIHVFYVASVV
jgi:hypothetical protein